MDDHPELTAVHIFFYQTVDVTASQKTIDFLTLLTRLGGATGVGKEVIWLLFLLAESWIFIYQLFVN